MNSKLLPDGIWPVMLTPFLDDGSIDWDAYDELIDFYIDSGASGLFATCLSGEIPALNPDECVELAARAVKQATGRVPVVGGAIIIGDMDTMVSHALRISRTGVDAVVISPSQFVSAEEDNDVLKEKLTEFLNKMDPSVPLGIYECPYPYHRFVDTAILEMISQTDRFLFIKDTCANVDLLKDKIAVIQGTPMKLYNANARTLIESIQMGASGYCGVGANFFAEPYLTASNPNAVEQHLCKAKTLLTRVEQAIGQSNAYPSFAKYYLNRTGKKISATCRIPQEPAGEWDDLTRWLQDSREEFIRATA